MLKTYGANIYDSARKCCHTVPLEVHQSCSNYELTPMKFSHTLMHIITTVIDVIIIIITIIMTSSGSRRRGGDLKVATRPATPTRMTPGQRKMASSSVYCAVIAGTTAELDGPQCSDAGWCGC